MLTFIENFGLHVYCLEWNNLRTAVALQHADLGMSNNVPDSVMKLIHDDLQTEVIKVFFLCW